MPRWTDFRRLISFFTEWRSTITPLVPRGRNTQRSRQDRIADPFRWHLNAFLRALKEVPQITSMALQNAPGFAEWFRPQRASLSADPLVLHLADQRDLVVHRGMLKPRSIATLGITDGRVMRLTHTNWEGVGVDPDIKVPAADALATALKRRSRRSATLHPRVRYG
jgi:hypothetical protein